MRRLLATADAIVLAADELQVVVSQPSVGGAGIPEEERRVERRNEDRAPVRVELSAKAADRLLRLEEGLRGERPERAEDAGLDGGELPR